MTVEAIGDQVLRDLEAVLTAEQKIELLCRWEYEALGYTAYAGAYETFTDGAYGTVDEALEIALSNLLSHFVGCKIIDWRGRRVLERAEAEALAEELIAEVENPRSSTSPEVQTAAAKFRACSLLVGLKPSLSGDEIVDWDGWDGYEDFPKASV